MWQLRSQGCNANRGSVGACRADNVGKEWAGDGEEAAEVLSLPGGRLLMEAQAMFTYGAAAASLRLLWRYRLLDVLMPPLAERFMRRRLPRCAHTLPASASGGSLYYWWQLEFPVSLPPLPATPKMTI